MDRNSIGIIVVILLTIAGVVVVPQLMKPMVHPDMQPAPVAPADDDAKAELREKVGRLALRIAFTRYDADTDAKLDHGEIKTILHDAGVGNILTRGTWATNVIAALDLDKDGAISWDELQAAFK